MYGRIEARKSYVNDLLLTFNEFVEIYCMSVGIAGRLLMLSPQGFYFGVIFLCRVASHSKCQDPSQSWVNVVSRYQG